MAGYDGLKYALSGTYKLLDIRDQSAQLVRRSDLIHFKRYDIQDRAHQRSFRRVLHAFEAYFDFPEAVQLVPDWKEYFVRSVGCVGILKDWLRKVYEKALDDNLETFDLKFALSAAHSNKELITIAKDAQAGEIKLLDASDDDLMSVLRPITKPAEPDEKGEAERAEATAGNGPRQDVPMPSKRSGSARVGQRLPKRDPVGRSGLAA